MNGIHCQNTHFYSKFRFGDYSRISFSLECLGWIFCFTCISCESQVLFLVLHKFDFHFTQRPILSPARRRLISSKTSRLCSHAPLRGIDYDSTMSLCSCLLLWLYFCRELHLSLASIFWVLLSRLWWFTCGDDAMSISEWASWLVLCLTSPGGTQFFSVYRDSFLSLHHFSRGCFLVSRCSWAAGENYNPLLCRRTCAWWSLPLIFPSSVSYCSRPLCLFVGLFVPVLFVYVSICSCPLYLLCPLLCGQSCCGFAGDSCGPHVLLSWGAYLAPPPCIVMRV